MNHYLIEFIDLIRKAGLEWFDRYYSVYPAVVEDTNDPEMRGRIKISLPSILGEGVELAQWVLPVGVQIGGDQTGGFFPPYADDIVDVIFENGDINFPRYIGGFWAQDELPSDFTAGYGEDSGPTIRGWVFKSGQKLIVDETDGKLKLQFLNGDSGASIVLDDTSGSEGLFLTHASGSQMQFTKDGSIILATAAGNLIFLDDADGAITLTSANGVVYSIKDKILLSDASGKNIVNITDSSVEITSSSDVIVTGQNVNINSGNINLGNGAGDNAVLYSKLASIFDSHSHLTALGPSGPPGPIPTMTMSGTEAIPPLSAKAGNIKLKGNL